MAKTVIGTLQSPVDPETGERSIIHPVTESDAVVCKDEKTLTELLDRDNFPVGDTQPDYPCLWFNVSNNDG